MGPHSGVDVRALAVEVDEQHGLGQPPLPRPALQGLGQQRGVHVPGDALAVHEGGPAAHVDHGVGAGGKGQGGNEHLVARAHAGQEQGQVQRGRARAEGQGMARAHGRGEIGPDRVHAGAARH